MIFQKVHFSSVTQSCQILCEPMQQHARLPCPSQGIAQTHVHWVGDAIQPSHPVLSPASPAFNLSQHQGLFHWISSSHQMAKVLELQHQSFQWTCRTEMDWLDLLVVQRTLKSLFQHHSSKASILRSHIHMTTGKTVALTRLTFVGKVMSLLFNMLSRLVLAFLPRRKCLLI